MTDHEETMQPSDFKDRKVGLVVFGILEVILGAFCALSVPLMIFGMIASATLNKSPAAPMSAGMIIPGVLFYALLAVGFIWMGIGSIKARRWARALWLVCSWVWLISGISGLILVLLLMPDVWGQMGKSGQMPQEMAVIMKYGMIGFLAVFYVIIPGALVLFYGSKNVKATCESRDPHIRWTDKCPLPVLSVSLIFAVWAVSILFMGLYGWVIPFFGFILSGMTGAAAALAVMLVSAYAAWGTYKLSIKAWWCSVLLIVAWTVSVGITFSRVSMWEFYEKMGFPQQQLDIMKHYDMPQGSSMALFVGFWAICFLGLLLYTKRYFGHPSEEESASLESGI